MQSIKLPSLKFICHKTVSLLLNKKRQTAVKSLDIKIVAYKLYVNYREVYEVKNFIYIQIKCFYEKVF